MKKLLLVFLSFIIYSTKAQETIGLVFNDLNREKSNGYTLFSPTSDRRVFLINNCGEVVKKWEFSSFDSRNCYLLENGNILLGSEEFAEIRDWDNNLVWSLDYNAVLGFRTHHDIEPLPNGNFLVLVRDPYSKSELMEKGLRSSYSLDVMVLQRIVEIKPIGTNDAEIVWEWKLFDHLIQDYDANKSNYGEISLNPQLLDINYDGGFGSNPIHANAIDYNPELDQIAVSSRHLSTVFVLDHSTSTEEAASHTGGMYGKGGDFLWRWGNPQVYRVGTNADKKLGRQHDIKWITEGPDKGKMSVFNNDGFGFNLRESSIHIIDQSATNGVYQLGSGKFLPNDYFWSYSGTIMSEIMHAGAQSGVQMMANGNALINESDIGRITEVDKNGNVVWVYIIPVGNNSNFVQYSQTTGNNSAFRAHRYSENYPGFTNKTFENYGIIENVNTISDMCISSTLSSNDATFENFTFYPNPTSKNLNFNFTLDVIQIFDVTGKEVLEKYNANTVSLENLKNGIYFVKVKSNTNLKVLKIVKN